MAYTTVASEGGLFPSDLLDRIASGEAEGQRATDFGIDGGRRLIDETQSAFADARSFWDAFQRRRHRSSESATTLTREDWMVPFLELLGFDNLVVQRASAEAGGETFFISHRAGDDPDAPPVHIVALDEDLDRRGATGRRSPHAVVQEYLNRADALWGITTNGRRLRLLRDTTRFSKPTYLEFDLEGMTEGNLYSEFVLLYRLLHASRFPRDAVGAHECLLERYYQQGIDEGGRVREKLRDGVEEALKVLGTAFLSHPESRALRERIEAGSLDDQAYYRQLLRLVYRLLFLMVAEERRLIFPPDEADVDKHRIYEKYYSVAHLRRRCERYFARDNHSDLWQGLVTTFRLFRDDDLARKLGLHALNGELFGPNACADLENASCTNEHLLTAIRHLSMFVDEGPGRRRRLGTGQRRRVNYGALDVEEFGSVYESLLEYRPHVSPDPPRFDLLAGSERKQTGSYYTPPELVRELISSALAPVVEERLAKAKTREEKERALLSMKVCDPASGSGHFLLAAARRIARELAKARAGEDEPAPSQYREAVRDVIRSCIYAVDKNPLAVDLCKVALWIEGHSAGLPLSFLDHHVKCGDSLVGVFDLDVLIEGIPDDAYKPVTGDDKQVASAIRKRNKAERQGQLGLAPVAVAGAPAELAQQWAELARREERAPEDVHAKEELYERLRAQGSEWWKYKVACDLWTAAFFTPLRSTDESQPDLVPSTETVRRFLAQPDAAHGQVVGHAVALSQEQRFFHWPLEFPDVFSASGFDVVLGNPPWDQIQLDAREFFSIKNPSIAAQQHMTARNRAIAKLESTNPALYEEFARATHGVDSNQRFVHASGRFPRTSYGRLNSAPLFAELSLGLASDFARAGLIVPTGIGTDSFNQFFFRHVLESRALISLHGFENESLIFPGIHHATKFCLLTLGGSRQSTEQADLMFFAREVAHLRDETRHFTLSPKDFALLNPNTFSCPVFRSGRDAEIAKSIYGRLPVLVNSGKGSEGDPWSFKGLLMFMMNTDSHLFRSCEDLEADGWRLEGNVFAKGANRYLPLYEGKMVHQFDHRFGTYDGQTKAQANQGKLPELDDEQHGRPGLVAVPFYWVPEIDVHARVHEHWRRKWLLGWRDITSAVVLRTVVASVLPYAGIGNNLPIMLVSDDVADLAGPLLANLDSFALDYVARSKVGGMHLNFFIFQQLPVLPPSHYRELCAWSTGAALTDWLSPRVLELSYTARDLQPFANDLDYHGPPFCWDEERRFLLRCELDAAFFHLYGIERDDVDYIMETFPIVKRRDEARYREYRTKRVILEVYDAMAEAMRTGRPYQTLLDPPPADPRVAHKDTRARSATRR